MPPELTGRRLPLRHHADRDWEQEIEIGTPIPSLANTSTRRRSAALARDKAEQQNRVRRALDLRAHRPTMPCVVRLTRLAARRLDEDNVVGALKYVRDTVARWAHGLAETTPALTAGGQIRLTKRGRLATTRPRAPDGPQDGICWLYAQDKPPAKGFQGVRIETAPWVSPPRITTTIKEK